MTPDFPIDIWIRLVELNFFLLLPDFPNSLPCWLSHQNWASQLGRKLAKWGSNKIFFQFCQSYSYVNRKVWCHQIWNPNNLGFMVLILMYMPHLSFDNTWDRYITFFFAFKDLFLICFMLDIIFLIENIFLKMHIFSLCTKFVST